MGALAFWWRSQKSLEGKGMWKALSSSTFSETTVPDQVFGSLPGAKALISVLNP